MKYGECLDSLISNSFNDLKYFGGITCELWDAHITKRVITNGGGVDSGQAALASEFIDPVTNCRIRSWSVFHPYGNEITHQEWRLISKEEITERFSKCYEHGGGLDNLDFQELLFNFNRPYTNEDAHFNKDVFKSKYLKLVNAKNFVNLDKKLNEIFNTSKN